MLARSLAHAGAALTSCTLWFCRLAASATPTNTRAQFCKHVVEETVRATGRLDVLVNNAAVQYAHAGLAQVTPQELEDVFATNMYAYFHCAAAALPHLKAGGAIINTSSVVAYVGARAPAAHDL
jgi:NAD(P)-dependent dehydrogenase (short-subunit alcohol dehydrogenase family)